MTFIHSPPMTVFMTDVTKDQRRWLEGILTDRRMTATELARRAGLDPSTLTRFLQGHREGHALSSRTVRKIEETVARRQAPAERGMAEDARLYHPDTAPSSPFNSALLALKEGRNGVDIWTVTTAELEGIRLFEGDMLVVDLNAEPLAGDVVCAQIFDWQSGGARTVFRLYEPPFLLTGSIKRDRRPLAVDGRNVMVRGVVQARLSPREMLHLVN